MARRRKIGGIEEDVLITGGLVVGGYLLLKGVLPKFGVSDADREQLDEQQTTAPVENIFKPEYRWSDGGDWLTQNIPWNQFETSDDYIVSAYRSYIDGQLSPDNQIYSTVQIYMELQHALIGKIFDGDQSDIITALNRITNKWQVSVISYFFMLINGVDLWDYLRNGSFIMIYGLNGADLAAAVRRLNNLPD